MTNSTYIVFIVIMAFGWFLGVFICPPSKIRMEQLELEEKKHSLKVIVKLWLNTMINWRVVYMIPMFFNANVFYSYQQNSVKGESFNIRTRPLNGALYWFAQIFGGLIIGLVLDMPKVSRPMRAKVGWALLFTAGMAIWGGGYVFQKWKIEG